MVYATHLETVPEPAACPGIAAWLERRMHAEPRIPIGTPKIDPLLTEACAALGYQPPPDKRNSLLFWAAMFARRLDRIRVADTVLAAGLPLRLYGRGWERVPRFAGHYRGVVTPGEPLRRVLREHKVVLHINGECNLHPRVLEGFCAGGFVLGRHEDSDDIPGETADQFAIGRELLPLPHGRGDGRPHPARPDRRKLAARRHRGRAGPHPSTHTFANRAQVILTDLESRLKAYVAR